MKKKPYRIPATIKNKELGAKTSIKFETQKRGIIV